MPSSLWSFQIIGSVRERLRFRTSYGIQWDMIKNFRHKGVQLFFETGSKAKIRAAHAGKLQRQLLALNRASQPEGMDVPGWRLHPLRDADLQGHWSVWVNGNWRLPFAFEGQDAVLVDYQNYH